MRFHNTATNRLGESFGRNFLLCNLLLGAGLSFPVARHSWCHGSFQFDLRILGIFFVVFVIRIDEVSSSESSNIVEFGLLVFPFLLLSGRMYPSGGFLSIE